MRVHRNRITYFDITGDAAAAVAAGVLSYVFNKIAIWFVGVKNRFFSLNFALNRF